MYYYISRTNKVNLITNSSSYKGILYLHVQILMLNSILSSLRLKHVLTELPSGIPFAKESMRHCRQRVIATPFTSTLTRQV